MRLSDLQSTSALQSDISSLIETVSTAEVGASNTKVLANKLCWLEQKFLKQKTKLQKSQKQKPDYFRVEKIQNDNDLFHFYTGFISQEVFYEFLDPVVNELNDWGTHTGKQNYQFKLSPIYQLFWQQWLRLNLKIKDLAFRLSISIGQAFLLAQCLRILQHVHVFVRTSNSMGSSKIWDKYHECCIEISISMQHKWYLSQILLLFPVNTILDDCTLPNIQQCYYTTPNG